MATTPNYELLKDAYAIIAGIPEEQFDLSLIVSKRGESLDCGTIACAFGWLSMYPNFSSKLKPVKDGLSFSWIINGDTKDYYVDAAVHVFNIQEQDARNLFCSKHIGKYGFDAVIANKDKISDKHLFLKRLEKFLTDNGQWKGFPKPIEE